MARYGRRGWVRLVKARCVLLRHGMAGEVRQGRGGAFCCGAVWQAC